MGCVLGIIFGSKIVKNAFGAEVAPKTVLPPPWRPKGIEKEPITSTKCWQYLHNSFTAVNKKNVLIAGWLAGLR